MEKEVNLGNKQVAMNMLFSFISFGISLFISFFFTPYLIDVVGKEAYSFFPLTNNLIGYTTILSTAVGSMAGRFIIMEFYGGNIERAKMYFNTVFVANICLSVLFSVIAFILCFHLENILNIPLALIFDVKVLFSLTFICLIFSLPMGIFGVGLSVKNRNDIGSKLDAVKNLIRVSVMFLLFYFFNPSIIYIGVGALVAMLYGLILNLYYKRKYLPEIPINPKKYFNMKAVYTLISSGIWNSFNQLSAILLNQVDLFVCNLFVSAAATGDLAISKTCPVLIDSVMAMMSGAFMSKYNILLAKKMVKELVNEIMKAIKIMSTFIGIPLGLLLVFGESFFTLWIPGIDAHKIYLLSSITITPMIIGASIYPILGTYTITNKLRIPAFVLFVAGIFNILFTYWLLKTTNLGIWAIPLVSAIQYTIRHSTFSVIFGAKSIGQNWYTFYPILMKAICGELIVLFIGFTIKSLHYPATWAALIIEVLIVSLLALIADFFYMFNKCERCLLTQYIYEVIKKKIL